MCVIVKLCHSEYEKLWEIRTNLLAFSALAHCKLYANFIQYRPLYRLYNTYTLFLRFNLSDKRSYLLSTEKNVNFCLTMKVSTGCGHVLSLAWRVNGFRWTADEEVTQAQCKKKKLQTCVSPR